MGLSVYVNPVLVPVSRAHVSMTKSLYQNPFSFVLNALNPVNQSGLGERRVTAVTK